MSTEATLWLPPPGAGDVERAIRWALERWFPEWLADAPVFAVSVRPRAEAPSLAWAGRPGARLALWGDAGAALGLAICGGKADTDCAADREVVQALAERCIDDVGQSLAEVVSSQVRPRESAADSETIYQATANPGGWAIAIGLGKAEIVALRRTASNPKATARITHSRLSALGPEIVELGCHLGEAELTSRALASLAQGDVVVLDRRAQDLLPITVEGWEAADGRARITATHGAAQMAICERIGLTRKVMDFGE